MFYIKILLEKALTMEITPAKVEDEEREEGEIVEDDLEDVSDCSMTPGSPLYFGKSVSPPEPLSAVCLSSLNSSDYSKVEERRVRDKSFQYFGKSQSKRHIHRRKRKLGEHVRRKNCHTVRRRRKSVIESNSDTDNESVDPKYAKQLREAIQRESSQELQNTLKTRLKAFIETGSHSDDDAAIDDLRNIALLSTIKDIDNLDEQQEVVENSTSPKAEDAHNASCTNELKDEDKLQPDCASKASSNIQDNVGDAKMQDASMDDAELQELRLAALKSFVIENHERRKKKAKLQDSNDNNSEHCSNEITSKDEASDIDKENDQTAINNDTDSKLSKKLKQDTEKENIVLKQTVYSTENTNEKKLSNSAGIHVDNLIEEDEDILRASLLASMSHKLAEVGKGAPPNKTSGFPKTISDIRKVEKSKYNSLSVTISKPSLPSLLRTIKNDLCDRVDGSNNHIINEQPCIIVKPLIINVNGESDSDTENNTSINNMSHNILNDNITEFLKKQRAEVEAAAKTKPEVSDSSFNKSDDPIAEKSVMKLLPRSQQLEYRKLKQIIARKRARIRRSSQRLSETKREAIQNIKKVPRSKTDNLTNSGSAGNSKISRNIQEKKIDEPASNLQKTLNDLQIRRNGRLQMKGKYRSLAPLLHKIHQASNERRQHELEIKKLLQEIEKARNKLATSHQNFTGLVQQLIQDKSAIDQRFVYKVAKFPSGPFTSTPNKLIKKEQPIDIINSQGNTATEENSKDLVENGKMDNIKPTVQHQKATINLEDGIEASNANQNKIQEDEILLDPNDVTKVFVEQPTTFLKYTSPLDNRCGINNPSMTVCPYDLLGVCKDKDCPYMHCS